MTGIKTVVGGFFLIWGNAIELTKDDGAAISAICRQVQQGRM
jgi:hypothetical protein